jgi:hypothetical protein
MMAVGDFAIVKDQWKGKEVNYYLGILMAYMEDHTNAADFNRIKKPPEKPEVLYIIK